jgi:hypothetical protein
LSSKNRFSRKRRSNIRNVQCSFSKAAISRAMEAKRARKGSTQMERSQLSVVDSSAFRSVWRRWVSQAKRIDCLSVVPSSQTARSPSTGHRPTVLKSPTASSRGGRSTLCISVMTQMLRIALLIVHSMLRWALIPMQLTVMLRDWSSTRSAFVFLVTLCRVVVT